MGRTAHLLSTLAALSVLAVSCAPTVYTLDVEMRQPSSSGLDLGGKSMSVVYLHDGSYEDSLFSANMAKAFAESLEKDYYGGDSLITIFTQRARQDVAYSSKEEMLSILVESGSDVVFLFDQPRFGEPVIMPLKPSGSSSPQDKFILKGSIPYDVSLFVYDSMDPRDKVFEFSGKTTSSASAYVSGMESDETRKRIIKANLGEAAAKSGRQSGKIFFSKWKLEHFQFFVYDNDLWLQTYAAVNEYEWQKAIDLWMGMLDTGNLQKKACIEYNIAQACYLSGQYELAMEWLLLSERDDELPFSASLKNRIRNKLD